MSIHEKLEPCSTTPLIEDDLELHKPEVVNFRGSEQIALETVIKDSLTELQLIQNLMELAGCSNLESKENATGNVVPCTIGTKRCLFSLVELFEQMYEDMATGQGIKSLENSIERELTHQKHIDELIRRGNEMSIKVKEVQEEIECIIRTEKGLVDSSKTTLQQLKIQVQEIKSQCSMEDKYINRSLKARLIEKARRQKSAEQKLGLELDKLQVQFDQESRSRYECLDNLTDSISHIANMQEFWQHQCEDNIKGLQQKLEHSRAEKAKHTELLKELTKNCEYYEAIIREDREIKEQRKEEHEFRMLVMSSTVKIQSWWRTIMASHMLDLHKLMTKKKKRKAITRKRKEKKK